MHILVVSQHFYPDQFRINEICFELVKRGHKVSVITSLPDYTTSYIPREYKNGKKRNETINGVQIHRVPTISRGKGAFKRFVNYLSFAISGWLYGSMFQKEFDVAFVYQTSPVSMAVPAIEACKKYKKKLLVYCCDVWPESTKAFHLDKKTGIYNIVQKISEKIYNKSDIIAVTSRPFIEYLNTVNHVPKNKIVYIPQHGEDMLKSDTRSEKNHKTYNFVFAGNIGAVQNVDCIIRAASLITQENNICIHIVGDGSMFEEVKQLSNDLGVNHIVKFHGRHSIDQMPEFYSLADCFLLTLTGESFIGMTVPAKLQGYMSVGKPIVGAIDGASKDIINNENFGICVDAGDYKALSQAMMHVANHKQEYENKGKNARVYYERNFTLEVFLQKLEHELNLLI